MASTPVEFKAPSGLTLTLSLYAFGSDTLANSGGADACTERTNAKGIYTATVTEAVAGWCDAKILSGSNLVAAYVVNMADDTNTHRCCDLADIYALGGDSQSLTDLKHLADSGYDPATGKIEGVKLVDTTTENTDMRGTDNASTLNAAGVRTAVGLASANLDTQLGDIPTNAELATALGGADDAVLAAIAALNNLSQANIRTAIGLGSANLDTQLGDLPTNAELATSLAAADDAVLAAIAALNNLSAAQVNAEVVDALATDTYAEPASVPAATSSLKDKINWVFKLMRNKREQTADTETVYADDGTTPVATSSKSDDATTLTRGKWTT